MKIHRDLDDIPRIPTDCPMYDETCKQLEQDKLYGYHVESNDDYFGVTKHNLKNSRKYNKYSWNRTNYSPIVIKPNDTHYKIITAQTETQHHTLQAILETLTKYPILPLEIANELWRWPTLKALIKQKILKIWRHDKHGPCLDIVRNRACPYCKSTKFEAVYKNLDKIVYCIDCQGTYYIEEK